MSFTAWTHISQNLDVVVLKFTLWNIKRHCIKPPCCLYFTTSPYRRFASPVCLVAFPAWRCVAIAWSKSIKREEFNQKKSELRFSLEGDQE